MTGIGRDGYDILVVGGGPAGLAFAYLAARDGRGHRVTVVDQLAAGDAPGWGIVLPEGRLSFLDDFDEGTLETLAYCDIVHRGVHVPIGGLGLRSVGRDVLLAALRERCRRAGVVLREGTRVGSVAELRPVDYDLVVAADGVNSIVRRAYEPEFGTRYDEGRNRYLWLGARQIFHFLTIVVRAHGDGVFAAHAYRYRDDASTFIVECDHEAFVSLDLARRTPDEISSLLAEVFAPELAGYRPEGRDGATWRAFTTVTNQRASFGTFALVGDALQTGHFSVGSGTSAAIDGARMLADALSSGDGVQDCLARYETAVLPMTRAFRTTADASRRWFEGLRGRLALDADAMADAFCDRLAPDPAAP